MSLKYGIWNWIDEFIFSKEYTNLYLTENSLRIYWTTLKLDLNVKKINKAKTKPK